MAMAMNTTFTVEEIMTISNGCRAYIHHAKKNNLDYAALACYYGLNEWFFKSTKDMHLAYDEAEIIWDVVGKLIDGGWLDN